MHCPAFNALSRSLKHVRLQRWTVVRFLCGAWQSHRHRRSRSCYKGTLYLVNHINIVRRKKTMGLLFILLLVLSTGVESAMPIYWWDMAAANDTQRLTYDEQVSAFAAQGLINYKGSKLFFDIGPQNFDWPSADKFWRTELQKTARVTFINLEPSFCSLIKYALGENSFAGLVLYDGSQGSMVHYGDGYSTAIALTIAGQRRLLPVSTLTLERHRDCLGSVAIQKDLREVLRQKTRLEAWNWAIETLLPHSSKKTVFNLNRYRVSSDPKRFLKDPQSNATASSIDYIIQQNAFVLDLESHSSDGHSTAPRNADDALIERVFSSLDPLFDAYGWADDEFSWTNETSHFGGTIFCSFASPNLSFWSLFPLENGQKMPQKLPNNDGGRKLDKSKYYVTFETNEGDTPRILVSAMASAWAAPERGSIPIAWAIDPYLAERFPSLFNYFSTTATKNDSFIAGTAGAGYAYPNQMSEKQLEVYAERVGRLTQKFGPHVFDTYGYANISVHEKYAAAAARGGAAPKAFVTQPNWKSVNPAYSPFRCKDDSNMVLSDGTPLICTSGNPSLFYYSKSLNATCPSCDLAARIKDTAHRHPPPYFVLVYGGLQAFGGSEQKSKKNFFPLVGNTIQRLGDDFVVIGASELARLARESVILE